MSLCDKCVNLVEIEYVSEDVGKPDTSGYKFCNIRNIFKAKSNMQPGRYSVSKCNQFKPKISECEKGSWEDVKGPVVLNDPNYACQKYLVRKLEELLKTSHDRYLTYNNNAGFVKCEVDVALKCYTDIKKVCAHCGIDTMKGDTDE